MPNAVLEKIDLNGQNMELEEILKEKVPNGSLTGGKSKQDVLEYIDRHAK